MIKGSKHSEETKKKIGESSVGMLGRNHSEETKKKISLAHKGKKRKPFTEETRRKMSEAQTGEKNHRFGKTNSEKHRRKIGEAQKGEKNCMFGKTGEKSPHWNPNLTDECRQDRRQFCGYKNWRKSVYEKDNYTCRKCGCNKSGTLNVHHIEGYSYNKELQTVVENGITFCKTCHKDFHHQYGIESTAEKVKEFLKENRKWQ